MCVRDGEIFGPLGSTGKRWWRKGAGRAGVKCRRESALGSRGNGNAAVGCRDGNKAVVLIWKGSFEVDAGSLALSGRSVKAHTHPLRFTAIYSVCRGWIAGNRGQMGCVRSTRWEREERGRENLRMKEDGSLSQMKLVKGSKRTGNLTLQKWEGATFSLKVGLWGSKESAQPLPHHRGSIPKQRSSSLIWTTRRTSKFSSWTQSFPFKALLEIDAQ